MGPRRHRPVWVLKSHSGGRERGEDVTAMGGVSPPRLRFLFVFLLVVRGCGLPPVSASCVFCCCFLVTWRGAPTDGGPLPLPSLQRESIDCISCCVGLRGGGVVRSGSRWGGGECGRKRVGRLQSQSQRRRRRRPRRQRAGLPAGGRLLEEGGGREGAREGGAATRLGRGGQSAAAGESGPAGSGAPL